MRCGSEPSRSEKRKGSQLQHRSATESLNSRSENPKACSYIFSVLPLYFTSPLFWFWRSTSALL
jgi:hypothetical protein